MAELVQPAGDVFRATLQPGTTNGSTSNGGAGSGATVRSRPGEKFSGLAIEDTRDRARQLQDELIQEGLARAVGKTSTSEPAAQDGKRDRDEHDRAGYERDSKRSRRSRSRSRERDHDRHRERRRGDDDRDRRRDGDRDRDRHRDRDRDTDRYRDGEKGRSRGSPDGPRSNRMAPPDAPLVTPTTAEQHGIYRAVVSNVMDFGAFCELQVCCRGWPPPSTAPALVRSCSCILCRLVVSAERMSAAAGSDVAHTDPVVATSQGLRTRQEGLVHVQNMSKTRVGSAKDVVKRGQEVWVKVISMQGQKISLSMRDVDQVRFASEHDL